MKLAVLKERRAGEARVAATPETVKKLKGLGLEIVIETGAGAGARLSDADYEAAGASIADSSAGALRDADADIVLKVRGPGAHEIAAMKQGAVLVALLAAHVEKETIGELATRGVVAFAMEFIPRISRAQSMDVLSSQANLAGYKAVIDAAAQFGRAFPM
ncbi:MAG TPA: NAD(P)(+) transhydrogenase (Re/Si-specific) subunit alpha, partial [Rhizomicrobium sp.]